MEPSRHNAPALGFPALAAAAQGQGQGQGMDGAGRGSAEPRSSERWLPPSPGRLPQGSQDKVEACRRGRCLGNLLTDVFVTNVYHVFFGAPQNKESFPLERFSVLASARSLSCPAE